MGKYQRGDVVIMPAVLTDRIGYIDRPAIVLKESNLEKKYFVLNCNTDKDKYKNSGCRIIEEGTVEFVTMGLWATTILVGTREWVKEWHIAEKIGTCPFIEQIPLV